MIEVIGNNLAAIVCCSELVRHDISVRHVSKHGVRLGGHFSGILYNEKRIDFGMVLLEPRFDLSETDIIEYRGQFGQQMNQFNRAVFQWLKSRNVVLNSINVLSNFRNKLIGDVVIADDLSFLSLLPLSEQQAISDEITERIQVSKHHPRDKANSTYFQETGLRDVYYEIYGPLFSSYLLGNLELLAGPCGPEVASQFHRLLWAPLYYPENIVNYLKTGDSGIPLLDFLVPNNGSVSQLIDDVIEELKNSDKYYSQFVSHDQYLALVKDRIRDNSIETLVFADERELFDESLNPPSSMVGVVVAETDSNLEFIVHNLDTEAKWYRATLRGNDLGVAVIELGRISPDETDYSLLSRANQCAESLHVGPLTDPEILKSNVYSFTPNVSALFRQRHLTIKKRVGNSQSCNLTSEITGSFNNQVCLGLSTSQVIIRATIK